MRNRKRLACFVCRGAAAVYFFLAGMLLFGANGSAYIDPSVVTYLIQAFAGVFIALGAVVGIYWRRIVKYLDEQGIHLTGKKEIESDQIIFYEEGKPEK